MRLGPIVQAGAPRVPIDSISLLSSPRTSAAGEEGDRRGLWPRGAHGSDQSELLEDRERSGPKAGTCKCPRALVPGLPCRTSTLQISVLVGERRTEGGRGTHQCAQQRTPRIQPSTTPVNQRHRRGWGRWIAGPGGSFLSGSRGSRIRPAHALGWRELGCGGAGGHSCPVQGPSTAQPERIRGCFLLGPQ